MRGVYLIFRETHAHSISPLDYKTSVFKLIIESMLELSFCQYTFPKVTITLNDIVKLHAEEITASVDLEGLLLTKKLKIGSLSVSLFDKLVQYKYYKHLLFYRIKIQTQLQNSVIYICIVSIQYTMLRKCRYWFLSSISCLR